MNSKVSIVMPARDAADTIGLAIESCLSQTYPNFELILVDHHSQDTTWSIMKKYARRDHRVQTLKTVPGASFISAVNLAWTESKGTLIARMDADDFSYPARLQYQVKAMTENPDWAACGTLVRIRKRSKAPAAQQFDLFSDGGDDGEVIFTQPDGGYAEYETWLNSVITPSEIAAQRFIDSPIANPSSIIRRSVLEEYRGYADEAWAEDYDLWQRMLENGEQIGKVDQILLDWHDSENRATRTQPRYAMEQFHLAKAHYLARLSLVQRLGVVIAGAGPIGKKLARRLIDLAIPVHAFADIHERRLGQEIHGAPVIERDEIAKFAGSSVLIGAVGIRGERKDTRRIAKTAGFREGIDFFCVA